MKTILALLATGAILILSGCTQPTNTEINITPDYGLTIHDVGSGVICYVYNGYQKGGISCLPPQ